MKLTTVQIVGIGAILAGIGGIAWYFLRGGEPPECDDTHPCPEGYICVDGVCVLEGAEGWIHAIVKECSQIPYQPFPAITVYANSHNCTTNTGGECNIENLSSGSYSITCDIPAGYFSYPQLPFTVEVQEGQPTPALILLLPAVTRSTVSRRRLI